MKRDCLCSCVSLVWALAAPAAPKDVIALNAAVADTQGSAPLRSPTELGNEIPHRDQQTPERAAVPLVKFQPGWLPHHVVPALAYNTRLTPDDVAFGSMLLKKDFKGDAEQY